MKFSFDPSNRPKAKAGIYRITCLLNGKIYIGASNNLQSRAREHARAKGNHRLANAIRKHGISNFIFEPIFYLLHAEDEDFLFLLHTETDLISQHHSIESGYNIIASSGRCGNYGASFSKIIRDWHSSLKPSERIRKAKHARSFVCKESLRANALTVGRDVLSSRMKKQRSLQSDSLRSELARKAGIASFATKSPEQIHAQTLKLIAYNKIAPKDVLTKRYENGLGQLSQEQLSAAGSKGALKVNSSRTPEERSMIARKAAMAAHASRTPEQRIALAKKAHAARSSSLTR